MHIPIADPAAWPVLPNPQKQAVMLSLQHDLGDVVITVDIPNKGPRVFNVIRCDGGAKKLTLLREDRDEPAETMYYFHQYDGVMHPTHEGYILSFMFYVASEDASANPSVYEATHVSHLGDLE